MQITDLREMDPGICLECSICIVGSGPAGLTIASELAGTPHQVLVIESGGRLREETFAAALNEVESVGAARNPHQTALRNRILGGSSHTWSGRCASLDPIDFEPREWVPNSNWPIGPKELALCADRAANYLGLLQGREAETLHEEVLLSQRLHLQEERDVRPVSWHFSRASRMRNDYVRFGPRFAKLAAGNIRVFTGATVTNIDTGEDGKLVQRLEIASSDGRIRFVKSRYFVLCGGGIENARMLLASNRRDPQGVGNRNGLVGRFLMDHPRATLGTFASEDIPVVQRALGLFRLVSGARIQCGLSLSEDVQRREQLLNCAAWTTQHVAEDDIWRTLRALRPLRGRELVAASLKASKNMDQIVPSLWDKFVLGKPLKRRLARLDLDVMVEQTPDPASRIRLSERKDALGVPLSQIDWRIGEMERRTAVRLGKAIHKVLLDAGMPTPVLADWVREDRPDEAVFMDAAHPAGTTRMAISERYGVVDHNCRVFGVDNLFVSGSSIFPTVGHANPTMTIVALSVRLADRLRCLVAATQPVEVADGRHLLFAQPPQRQVNGFL